MPESTPPPARQEQPATTGDTAAIRYFGIRQEWIVFWVSFLVTWAVYVYTLAPSVVLRDSGELVTAAAHLGVPHPPGYPLLTILSYLFTLIPVGNIAWRVNLLNATSAAAAVGVISMLICLSGRMMTQRAAALLEGAARTLWDRAVGFCSITAGLILAFSHVMWSQSVLAEKYAVNSLCLALILYFLYRWMTQEQEDQNGPEGKTIPFASLLGGGLAAVCLLLVSVMVAAPKLLEEISPSLTTVNFAPEASNDTTVNFLAFPALLCAVGALWCWIRSSVRQRHIYLTIFFYGLGLTAHQTLIVLFPAIILAVLLRETHFITWLTDALHQFLPTFFPSTSRPKPLIQKIRERFCSSCRPLLFLATFGAAVLLITGGLACFLSNMLDVSPHATKHAGTVLIVLGVYSLALPAIVAIAQENFFQKFLIFSLLLFNTAFGVFAYLSNDIQLIQICILLVTLSTAAICVLLPFSRPFSLSHLLFLVVSVFSLLLLLLLALVPPPNMEALANIPEAPKIIELWFSFISGLFLLYLSVTFFGVLILFFSSNPGTRAIPILFLCGWAGLSLYSYLYFAARTNPPMNWGYASRQQGFFHAVNRGQYENNFANTIKGVFGPLLRVQTTLEPKMQPGQEPPLAKRLSETLLRFQDNASRYLTKCGLLLSDMLQFFSLPVCLVSLITLFCARKIPPGSWRWLAFLSVCLFIITASLIYLIGGDLDRQSRWINRVFFIPSHILFAIFIGYGLMFGFWFLLRHRFSFPPSLLLLLVALPVFAKIKPQNRYNWELSEQRHHDFGWQYGYDMLIDCDKDSFIFGGTDPGRFVPTYMIFAESRQNPRWKMDQLVEPKRRPFDRRDMYIVTQNALADETYMNYIRDHYGYTRPRNYNWFERKLLDRDTMYPREPIWIPEPADGQNAFRQYVELHRQNPAAAPGIRISPDGRVSIAGIEGVFAINGLLAQMIFERNKNKVQFYVEESFPLGWMYPYLEPFGLIMRLNKDPLPGIPQDKIDADTRYWDAYTRKLLENPAYLRDEDARKAFSKLRVSIGGLYYWRAMNTADPKERQRYLDAAEYAFIQSIDLCPFSTESVFRYVEMLVSQERFDEAIRQLMELKKEDPRNSKIDENIATVQRTAQLLAAQRQLEALVAQEPRNAQAQLQLVDILGQRNRFDLVVGRVDQILKLDSIDPQIYPPLIQRMVAINRLDKARDILLRMTQRQPDNAGAFYELAVLESILLRNEPALNALEKALRLHPQFASQAVNDNRLNGIKPNPRFAQIINAAQQRPAQAPANR